MNIEKLLDVAIDTVANAAASMMPGALGAIVAQAWEKGLTLTERLVAIGAGCIISYYATALVLWAFRIDPFAGQSVGFVFGLVAYKAAPDFQRNAIATVVDLPTVLKDWISKRKGTDA